MQQQRRIANHRHLSLAIAAPVGGGNPGGTTTDGNDNTSATVQELPYKPEPTAVP